MTQKLNCYCKFMRGVAKAIFPKREVVVAEPLPEDETAIFICNHSGAIGPTTMSLYFDRPFSAWSISCMYDKKIAPNYIFHDFLFGRSAKCKSFYRGLSHIMAPMLRPILASQDPIIVYRNNFRITQTFRDSLEKLHSGKDVVIFAESFVKFSPYVNKLYDGFAYLAPMYHKLYNKVLKFYPVFIPTDIRTINIGAPVIYNPENNSKEERKRIVDALQNSIHDIASALPIKKITPFMKEKFYTYYGEYVDFPEKYWELCNQIRSD